LLKKVAAYRGQLVDARDADELSEQVEREHRVRVDAAAHPARPRRAAAAAQAHKTASHAPRHEREHRQRKHMLLLKKKSD